MLSNVYLADSYESSPNADFRELSKNQIACVDRYLCCGVIVISAAFTMRETIPDGCSLEGSWMFCSHHET